MVRSISALGSGLPSYVQSIAAGLEGSLVAANSSPYYVARWNGSAWLQHGPTVNNEIRALQPLADG